MSGQVQWSLVLDDGFCAVVDEVISGNGMEQAANLGWFAKYCV